MKVLVAPSAGFCFGVLRATEMAFDIAGRESRLVVTLGPIIHNPQVVRSLEARGVRVVARPADVPEGAVVILRSHGVPVGDLEELNTRDNVEVVEATCPFVKKVHEAVTELARDCDLVLVVGDADHPEVRSILSFAPDRALPVSSADVVGNLPDAECVGVVAQTTLAASTFHAVVSRCERRYARVRAVDTICNATAVRQREATALAGEVDAMVVVGGRESANTRRLAELCRAIRPEATFHVESAVELPAAELASCPVVGVTAGASTPEWVIAEVVERLRQLG